MSRELGGRPRTSYVVRSTPDKGHGVFARRAIRKGELVFHMDLRTLKKYTAREIDAHVELDGDHSDYAGHGKYVVDESPASFMNHSCEPNCFCKMKTIVVKDVYALRDIEEGEELTSDYTATSVDQFAGSGSWAIECNCGSENCRGRVTGDFFGLPLDLQRKYYPNLPPSIRKKYRARFQSLFKRTARPTGHSGGEKNAKRRPRITRTTRPAATRRSRGAKRW